MNKPQTRIPLQENAQQQHRREGGGGRLIDREDETALSGGVGCKKGERKGGRQGMKGCLAGQSVKEGRQNPGFSPKRKKKARISQDDGLKEGGRDED